MKMLSSEILYGEDEDTTYLITYADTDDTYTTITVEEMRDDDDMNPSDFKLASRNYFNSLLEAEAYAKKLADDSHLKYKPHGLTQEVKEDFKFLD